jgi:hypothetical protein
MRVERIMGVRSSNLVKADVWETNNTVTMVEMMKTRTIILFKNIHKYLFVFSTKMNHILELCNSVMVSDIKLN